MSWTSLKRHHAALMNPGARYKRDVFGKAQLCSLREEQPQLGEPWVHSTERYGAQHRLARYWVFTGTPRSVTQHLLPAALCTGAPLQHTPGPGSAAPLRMQRRDTTLWHTAVPSPDFTCLFKLFTLLRCRIALQKEHPFGCCGFKMTCIHHSIAFRSNTRS